MSVPRAFISVCERYANNNATELDKQVLQSLTTQTPLPSTIHPSDYGFNPITRLPDNLTLFQTTKNQIRAHAHTERTKSETAAILRYITNTNSTSPNFPNTLSSYPLQSAVKQALKTAIQRGCAVECRFNPELLIRAQPFVDAVRHTGFDVEVDREDHSVVFSIHNGSDWSLFWRFLNINDGDTLPAGVVNLAGPRKTGFASCFVKAVLRIV